VQATLPVNKRKFGQASQPLNHQKIFEGIKAISRKERADETSKPPRKNMERIEGEAELLLPLFKEAGGKVIALLEGGADDCVGRNAIPLRCGLVLSPFG
jgi:hypothetical protein